MGTLTYNRTLALTVVSCCMCAVEYAIPAGLNETLLAKKNAASTWCPNGHQWHYTGASDAELLRRAQSRATHLEDQRQAAERRVAAYKGQMTRLRNRVANGVCPCCNRTFANLARHMQGQHPEWTETEAK